MDSTKKQCVLWKNVETIYQKLIDGCCCSENEIEIKKIIQSSIEPADYSEENQFHLCLLGLSTINLLGKIIWQQNHQEICSKIEWLSKNVASNGIIHKLMVILLNCQNKHIIYSIRRSFIAFLFNYPKEISVEAENYISSFLIQVNSEKKTNFDLLEVLHDIVLFQRPQAESICSTSTIKLNSRCENHHKYDADDRTNEIKANCVNVGIHTWSDLSLCLKDKSSSNELQFIILEIWSCLIVTTSQFHLSVKDILIERSWKELLDASCQFSSNVCAKLFVALNQVLSQNYLQVTQVHPTEIIHLSRDIITMTKNGWLGKISLKTRCNSFSGKQASKSSGTENICLIHLRNVVLIIMKSLSIVIKSNELKTAENNFLVFNILMKWLRDTWNKNRDIHTDEEYLIELFLDQDDQLLEMMICSLNIYTYLQRVYRIGVLSETEVMKTINPHIIFLHFIQGLDYDYSFLLDLLTSNETCALFYLLQYLKLVKFEWHNFIQAHQDMNKRNKVDVKSALCISKCSDKRSNKELHSNHSFDKLNYNNENIGASSKSFDFVKSNWADSVHATIEMLIQLCSTIQRLLDKDLFPYNARPLIRILNDCEKLYNCNKVT